MAYVRTVCLRGEGMSHEVLWTDKLTEAFIKCAALSDDEAYIMRTRARGYTVTQQALALGLSESTVHRMISKLKTKYDAVQKEYPETFPVRKASKVEKFMDEN